MNHFLVLTAICIGFPAVWGLGDEDIRCVSSSCKDIECDAVPDKCKSNETNAGIYMLSPDICNCCDYCLEYMAEGEECSVGDPANAKHTALCGPGLTCVPDDGEIDGTCQKMSTNCALEQQSFDLRRQNGYLGAMETRAECDDDGLYGAYKCVPGQNCFCLHSNGSRIFGEANYNTIADYMSCECSRAYYDAADIIGRELHPHEHFRCDSTGSYDRIQCINEQCLCVDALDGAPTFPNKKLVDLEDISNETLSCYSDELSQGLYYKKCEEEYMIIHKDIEGKKNESG
uniref:Thyroglobulin type-1 domain-containing protein n=1 Tax=Dendroctonus ponderosae TaxID=77166 RepID=J3JXW2_DENPD|nr:unknown [Dendroctonus ponderosae]